MIMFSPRKEQLGRMCCLHSLLIVLSVEATEKGCYEPQTEGFLMIYLQNKPKAHRCSDIVHYILIIKV